MDSRSVKSGDLLTRRESPVDNIWYISEGRINAVRGSLVISLKKGDFIGLADFDTGISSFDYYAAEPSQIISFCTRDALLQTNFFASKPENCRAIALSLNHIVRDTLIYLNSLCTRNEQLHNFVKDCYDKYVSLCRDFQADCKTPAIYNELTDPVNMSQNHKFLYQYYKGMSMQLMNRETAAEIIKNLMIPGYMLHSAGDLQEIIKACEYVKCIVDEYNEAMINDGRDDLLNCYGMLLSHVGVEHSGAQTITETISEIMSRAQETPEDVKTARMQEMKASASLKSVDAASGNKGVSVEDKLRNSMDQILEFSNFPEETAGVFKQLINKYKNLADPNATEDEARYIRKDIEKYFYMLYLAALEASIEKTECPTVVKMFLNFGYLDEELAGMDNAVQLYDMAHTYKGRPESSIYTGYEWLLAIFTREKEPSINEFDQTYEQFIKEQADSGRIPAGHLKEYLKDRGQMVMFELQNMFRHASKICSGRVLNFCPVFCEHQILRSAKDDVLSALSLIEARDAIRKIDYTLFYRETVFVYNKKENVHDTIHVEILPDMILLPVVGSRGSMWQEISGRDRMTPARMMLPAFDVENVEKALLRIFAEYRWEMCKRVQGARWNDVTDPSLTSLYYDYLQFYRKNSEISTEQKEKIKIGLQRNRNSYKEFFISDYAEYIKYESIGAPHLIKASRTIMYLQCPFSAAVRNNLATNPIFAELNEKYKLKAGQQLHKLENIRKKLASKGYPIPDELDIEVAFYSK